MKTTKFIFRLKCFTSNKSLSTRKNRCESQILNSRFNDFKTSLLSIFFIILSLQLTSQKINIVTTTSIFADMASSIGQELVEVKSLVPVGSDPHKHEAKPSDISLIQAADIIFINGLNLEVWIEKLIKNSNPKAQIYTLTQGIDPLSSIQYHGAADPHAWMTANNGKIYAHNIGKGIWTFKPEIFEQIQKSMNKYIKALDQTDLYIKEQIALIPENKRFLVTSHDAFQYYGKAYGIELVPMMGISTEAEAQTSDMLRVIKKISDHKIPTIFVETTINPQMMQQIATDQKVVIGGSLYSDSLGDSLSQANTYLKMLIYNTDLIVQGLRNDANTIEDVSDNKNQNPGYLFYIILITILTLITWMAIKNIQQ